MSVVTAVRKGTSKNIKVFILFRFTEIEKMLPFYKSISVFVYRSRQSDESIEMWVRVKMWSCCAWIYARVCGGTAWADSLNFSGYVLFFASHFPNVSISLVSRSLCWKFPKTMITEDAILNFIGNWFQCFPVYPGLNLSSGSVSGSGSGFRIPAFPYAPRKHSGFVIYSYFKDSSFYGKI